MNVETVSVNKYVKIYNITLNHSPFVYTLKFQNNGVYQIHIETFDIIQQLTTKLPVIYEVQLLEHPQFLTQYTDHHEITLEKTILQARIYCLQTFPLGEFSLNEIIFSEFPTQQKCSFQDVFRQQLSSEPGLLIAKKLSKISRDMQGLRLMLKSVKDEGFQFEQDSQLSIQSNIQ
ncbi:hypothetical protein SS50377_20261 [Spironucleus salmonicida]|uniref:Uncharacterized protein n=1 Tax=Spironucleus salmonicida TaxID=348837 RepID=V6LL07_9EUKA|nr:hypothetical protein SS50377_20261 [Spironucleus salmonicida]|eukprot:EST45315.1 Hypothetical protein SS50377_14892 [Spironucleus salmonicida]